MKKATIEALYNYLNGATLTNLDEIKGELETELNRGKAQKEANAKVYEDAHDIVMANLEGTPVTIAELYEALEGKLPEGFTKGKLQHALTKVWKDEITKVEGNPNTYCKA